MTASARSSKVAFTVAPPLSKDAATARQVTRYHVQVGVFNMWQDAEALALRLKSLGYPVRVATGGSVHGSPVYRVWVGGYFDETTAERLAQTLQKAGFVAALTQ